MLTPRFDIKVDDRIRYRNLDWSMNRRRGDILDFVEPRSGELLSVTDEELAGLICSGQARVVLGYATDKEESYAAAVADLSTLRSADIEDGRRALAYTDELRRRGLTYRPTTADVQKAIAHVAARIGDPQPPAVYLVKRWQARSIRRAAAGGRAEDRITIGDLVPQHGFKGNRTSRVCFEVAKIIHEQVRIVYLTLERRSVDSVLSATRATVRKENEKRAPEDHLKLPGWKAVRSAIDSLPRDEVIAARYGSEEAYNQLGPVEYRERPEAPLDEVEVDHTTCDLFILDGLTGAPLGRPTIVVGVDRCTAMPWGLHVGFDPPSVHTVMQCMRNGMFPKNYVRIYAGAGIWDIEGSWPVFGRPRKIAVDRGAENINYDVKALGVDLPIKVIEAKAGRKGRLKGGIERFLGTLNRTLLHEQRGTTFSNIVERDDYDPKKNAVITYGELLEKIHQWLIDVYMRRKHNGIRDVPLRLWNEKITQYRPDQVENVDKLLPLFGRIEHRILRRDGIRWKHLFFTSPELMVLLSDRDFLKASTNARGDVVVRFRYDSSNVDHIHVYLPHARSRETMHLRVAVEKRARKYASGLSVWAHNAIVKIALEKAAAAVDLEALDRAKVKLIADLDVQTPGSAKMRGMTRIARIRQIGGVAPYGDCVRTTPKGSLEDMRQEAAITAGSTRNGRTGASPLQAATDSDLPRPSEIEPVEDDDVDGEFVGLPAPKPKNRKYVRRSDPMVASGQSRSARPGGKGRKAMPKTLVPSGEDEIDFYSQEVRA